MIGGVAELDRVLALAAPQNGAIGDQRDAVGAVEALEGDAVGDDHQFGALRPFHPEAEVALHATLGGRDAGPGSEVVPAHLEVALGGWHRGGGRR